MKKITILIALLYGFVSQAQLMIDNTTQTPAQLVVNQLVGQGVVPFNIKFNGSVANANVVSQQVAKFDTNFNPTNLGLQNGVALSTGNAQVAIGPNNDASAEINVPTALSNDPDLDLITTSSVQHVSIIEFDFVATGQSLNFDFVFASEEYPEYSNDPDFNDVFGFFLSGPGITGSFSNGAKNIALVPNTATPISINNVNNGLTNSGPCVNCAYYVANGTGTTPAINQTIQYDGFTTPIRATSQLQCGGTYHIKLAIGNVGDNQFDSAVFLKNFSIPPLQLLDDVGLDTNTDVCYGKTVIINSGQTVGTNIFTWFLNGVVIAGQNAATLSVMTGGTYTLVITTPGGCVVGQDDIVIQYRAPLPTIDPLDINSCTLLPAPYIFDINQTAYILGVQNPADYLITYYDSSLIDATNGAPTGIIPLPSLSNYSVSAVPKTIWVRIEETGGSGCVTVKPFTLNASAAPSGSIAYGGSPYCANFTTAQPMTGTVTGGGTYTATPAGLNINPTTGAINVGSLPNTYTVRYSIAASGSCPAFGPVTTTVVINPLPLAPTFVAPAPYCQNATATALTATGTNLLWYTAATGGVGSATAPTPSTTSFGTTNYYVSQTVLGCESPRAVIPVLVNPTPAAPTFTAVAPYCQGAVATPLTATGTNLLWYTAATGGVGSATAPTPSTATAVTTNYYVSQTVLGCESPRAVISVTVNPIPAAPTFTAPVYCQNATATALTATGTGLLWYTTATGGVGSATAPTPSTTILGPTNYYVSQTVLGCESPRATIVVNVTATPLAPTFVAPAPYCQNATATALTATGTNLLWYTAATGGVGSATAPTPSTTSFGTTNYYVSQTVLGCESPRAVIPVLVNPTPAAPTFTAVAPYCQGAVATPLTATGTGLLWYTAATGGVGSATAPTPSTTTTVTTNYYVSQTVLGCESPRAVISVTVNPIPAAPTFTAPVYCQNATATSLTAIGTGLLWYTTATGGVGSATAPTPSTTILGPTNYYVSQTVLGCESPRATIVVNVNATPLAPTFVAPAPYCQGATATALTATGSNLLWYTTAIGGVGSTTAPIPSTATGSTTNYYVSQTVGCESPRAMITVTVIGTPALPLVNNVNYCLNEVAVPLTATGSGLLWYTTATGGVGSAIAPVPSTATATTTNYYVSQTTGTCEGPRATIEVSVTIPPQTISFVTSDYFSDQQTVTVNVAPSGDYEYQIDNGGFQQSNVFTNVSPGTHTINVKNKCDGISNSVFIVDFPRYFTPNGDGFHDTWNISALSTQANAKIYIFDRLGKLLKEILPTGEGWTGVFNGEPLPATDYWFTVQYQEKNQTKEFKSHFALKR